MRKLLPIILITVACVAVIFAGLKLVQRRSALTGPSLSVRFLEPALGGGIVVRTPERTVLVIDPGPEGSAGELRRFLADRGFRKLVLLVSNPTRERAGAVESLVKSMRVSALYTGERSSNYRWWKRALDAARQEGVRQVALRGGDKLELSGSSRIEALSPPPGLGDQFSDDDGSLVIRLVYGDRSFLFTSDIGLRTEAWLIHSGKNLQSDVMTVPRGGRRGAASLELLSIVRPEVCVIGVRNNRQPADSVLKRLDTQNTGADVFRTDERGTVTVKTNGRSIVVDTQEADND